MSRKAATLQGSYLFQEDGGGNNNMPNYGDGLTYNQQTDTLSVTNPVTIAEEQQWIRAKQSQDGESQKQKTQLK